MSSIPRNEALLETVVNLDASLKEMWFGIGRRIWCSHVCLGSGKYWIVPCKERMTQEPLLERTHTERKKYETSSLWHVGGGYKEV